MLQVLLVFASISLSVACFSCQQLESTTSDQVWQIMKLSFFDRIFLLTAGSLLIIMLIFAILSWILYKSFTTPSDIMLAIIICELVQNSSLVAQAAYFTSSDSYSSIPNGFTNSCYAMGIVNIVGNVSSTYYNFVFCVILTHSIQNTLKGRIFTPLRYHILSVIITGSIVLGLLLTQGVGRGLNGVCGFRVASGESIARFVLQILMAVVCIYSMIRFRSKLPKNQYFQKQSVFGFYYYYMGIFAATQIISSLSFLVSDIMCRYNSQDIIQTLHVFYSISMCVSTLLSYAIVFLRLYHPLFQIKLIKLLKNKDKLNQSQKRQIQHQFQIRFDNGEDGTDDQSIQWLGNLLESLKGSQLLSFMEGIAVAFIQKQRKYYSNRQVPPLAYKRHYSFQISQQVVQEFIERRISSRQSLIVRKKLGGLTGLPYEVVSYCPQVFSSFCTKKQLREIIKSLNIKKNIKIVKQQSNTNGGKSGELFFGSYDNNLLFKTIKQDEVFSYLKKINEFAEYFKKQKQTLIIKILGVFKFQRNDIAEEPIFLILMYNITRLSHELNLRVYDIKGSQFNRSTMEQIKIHNKQEKLRKHTLKDKDFKELQNKVKINKKNSSELKKVIQRDIDFLGKLGFIDYSLLIIKRQGQPSQKYRGLSEMASIQEEGVIYNFGIIDYLESWTLKRKAQRVFKTLITSKEVTANSPLNYSSRLNQFIDTIL